MKTAAGLLLLFWKPLCVVVDAFHVSHPLRLTGRGNKARSNPRYDQFTKHHYHHCLTQTMHSTAIDTDQSDTANATVTDNKNDVDTDSTLEMTTTTATATTTSLSNATDTTATTIDATNITITVSSSDVDATNNSIYPETPSFRSCLSFALPALGIYACPPLMSLIDASFIGRSSSLELAALGPASSISDSAPLPLLFLSIASTNLIAKAFSQNDNATLRKVARTALGMGSIGGIILAILIYTFATPISVLYCGTNAAAATTLAPLCTKYVAIRALALPFVVLSTIAQAISIGTKDTTTPMVSVAMAGVLNFIGDLILVKWQGQGIAGAAWATALSQVLSAGLLLRSLKKRGYLERQQKQKQVIATTTTTTTENGSNTKTTTNNKKEGEYISTMTTVKQLMSFIPFLFVMGVKIFWHNSCSATAASLGGAQAAAHTALLSVAMLCFLLGDVGSSLSQAYLPAFLQTNNNKKPEITTTTTQNDKDDDAVVSKDNKLLQPTFNLDAAMPTIKQLMKVTLSISTAAICLSSTVIGIFGGQITSDPEVLAEMRRMLPWIVTALSCHGSVVTLEGLLLVRKKFKFLSVFYTFLGLSVAAFQVATKRFNLGLAGVWACYVWFCASRFFTFASVGGVFRPKRILQKISQGINPKSSKVQSA